MMAWFKCTDRMPPEEMWVLITLSGKVPRSPAYWDGTRWHIEGTIFPDNELITHWMQHPKPAED